MENNSAPTIWLTGLSGSGKTTIAKALQAELQQRQQNCYLLDGDILRQGLNSDLGFTEHDRHENLRRTGELCKILTDAGLIVIAALISPYAKDRAAIRQKLTPNYVEVFVDTPLQTCIERDPKGLYKKAQQGEIKNFTGLDAPYEAPQEPEIHIDTAKLTPAQAVAKIIQYLVEKGQLSPCQ
ncbi:adenylyl-sulfate kinase [Pseudidiomarina taiwanensis]|uniref:Adenylyl-sulfate kinase n=1 Tax=Pseudidiomarina taiwanensis TaxID=337250 RepID=A0A432ZK84_9GAMM|nr:adenylyl-sulfate kinase [Pseudidiomarina taiwanensis]RUO78381.1 adenylyl-sulfate kinase [Pseudidiomarina taiwanensis]